MRSMLDRPAGNLQSKVFFFVMSTITLDSDASGIWKSGLLLLVEHGADPCKPLPFLHRPYGDFVYGSPFEAISSIYSHKRGHENDLLRVLNALVEHGARPSNSELSILPESVRTPIEETIAQLEAL